MNYSGGKQFHLLLRREKSTATSEKLQDGIHLISSREFSIDQRSHNKFKKVVGVADSVGSRWKMLFLSSGVFQNSVGLAA
ncbi:hypothetical protein ACB092_01G196600 [Castanea dentata]